MSEYHKIETLYERDEQTHRLKQPLVLKNRVYGLLKSWHFTEKVDGTNIRCIWRGRVTFFGKSDNAQLHTDLLRWLEAHVTEEAFLRAFPPREDGREQSIILYGEGYGAGIQKGGGDYSPEKRFILFDVVVQDPMTCIDWWLSDDNVRDVGQKMGLEVVPSFGEMTLEDATEMVRAGIQSRCAVSPAKQAEGLVGRPLEALFDKKGHRLIVKLKTKDF